MDFKGKTAVVTGSSGGIGEGIALALAKEGADIVLAARTVPKLEKVEKEIEALGRRAVAVGCDVTRDGDVLALRDRALEAFGSIDILINNAAAGIRGRLDDVTIADWEHLIDVNLMGYIRVVHAFLEHFITRGSGYLVNVSSIQALGYTGETMNIPYITSKAGIIGLTDCLFAYLGPKGIKVSCLIPGGVRTDIHVNSRFVGTEEEKEQMKTEGEKMMKMPFYLSPEQLAEGLLEGMRKEDYLILVPDSREMLLRQGRNVDTQNAFMKKAIEPGAPPPFRRPRR
jgi:NAD(P)-dependent dehydrogenase (short-subunit alcohol dehydrogenase family)